MGETEKMGGMNKTELAELVGISRWTMSRAINTKNISADVCEKLGEVTRPYITAESWLVLSPTAKKKAFKTFAKEYDRKRLQQCDQANKKQGLGEMQCNS